MFAEPGKGSVLQCRWPQILILDAMVTEQRRSQVPGEIHGAHPLDILGGEGVIGLPEGLQFPVRFLPEGFQQEPGLR